MKYKKFLLLPMILFFYIIFANLIGIDYEYYGTSYSSMQSGSGTQEIINAPHSLEVIVVRHRILFGLLPSYGFRSFGFARGKLILYNPGSLSTFHTTFLIIFVVLLVVLALWEYRDKNKNFKYY